MKMVGVVGLELCYACRAVAEAEKRVRRMLIVVCAFEV